LLLVVENKQLYRKPTPDRELANLKGVKTLLKIARWLSNKSLTNNLQPTNDSKLILVQLFAEFD
jgi:hypothetical protein